MNSASTNKIKNTETMIKKAFLKIFFLVILFTNVSVAYSENIYIQNITNGCANNTINVLVLVDNSPNIVQSFGFEINYDDSILQYTGNYTRGNLTAQFVQLSANSPSSGRIIVGGYTLDNAIPIEVVGSLVNLEFLVNDCSGSPTSLELINLVDNIESWTSANGNFSCNIPPEAIITYSPTTIFANSTVSFDGSSSTGNILTYSWDFGDGTTGTDANPTHIYTGCTGEYIVTLTVSDGCTEDSTTATINVENRTPVANVTYSPATIFANSIVAFDASSSYDLDGDVLTYNWDFGDETTGTGTNPTHIYTSCTDEYIVTLTVSDGCTEGSTTTTINVENRAPVADVGGPYTEFVGTPVSFDGSNSSDLDSDVLTYDWDFGDGTTETGINSTPTNIYSSRGDFTVTLTVNDGCTTNSAQTSVTITCSPSGDVNGDGRVTPGDALLTFEQSMDPDADILDTCERERANVNQDEDSPGITPGDASCIFEYYMEIEGSCLEDFYQN